MDTTRATGAQQDDRILAVNLLNRALATELMCLFRYRRHYEAAQDVYSPRAAERLLLQAEEEFAQAERITRRIIDLGGIPDFRLETVPERSFVEYTGQPGEPDEVFLPALLDDDLAAEEIAADAYSEVVETLGDRDTETCRLFESLIAGVRAHAAGLGVLRQAFSDPGTGVLRS